MKIGEYEKTVVVEPVEFPWEVPVVIQPTPVETPDLIPALPNE